MRRSGEVVLEQQFASKDVLFERLKCCLRAVELIQSTSVERTEVEPITLTEWTKTRIEIYAELKFKVHLLNLPEREARDTYNHIDLAFITDHTVTQPQFEVLFTDALSHNVDYFMQNPLWEHNTQCLLFFIRGYATILQTLKVMVDTELYYAGYLDNAQWLQYLLTTFHEVRKFFPFCGACPQNVGQQCKLWMDILLNLNEVLSGPRDKHRATALRRYFKGLDISCPIPKTLEDLKQIGGI